MDNFVVSARKYRPITFDSVVGQESITSTLKNAIKNNHLAQAFLFTGPRGVGKTTCARIFAKTINCYHLNEKMEPCDECESCVSFNQSNSFNIHELDAASNNSVEDIRRLVEQVRIPPQVGQYKVYIIDEVHMLSQAAFNAFLKTLEEPPAYAKFILATTEKHKIIPTILSRCQIYDFNRITVKDISKYLAFVANKEGVTTEEDALMVMAQKADGAMRDALSIFDQIVSFAGKDITYKATIENLNVLDTEYYFQMVSLFLRGEISGSLIIFNDIISRGFDGLHFINGLATHIRNLLVSKDKQTLTLLETSENIRIQYINQASKCSLKFLVFSLDLCASVDLAYKSASDKRLLIELNLMKICKLNHPFQEMNSEQTQAAINTKKIETPKLNIAKDVEKKDLAATITEKPNVKKENNNITKETSKKNTPISNVEETEQKAETDKTKDSVISTGLKRSKKSRGISIKQSIINKEPEADKVNISDALETKFDNVKKLITENELQAAIEKYIALISKDKPAFASAIEFRNVTLLANNEVHVHLANQAMDDKELKYDLLSFLKSELSNNEIQITTELKIAEIKPKETSMDIYRQMVEKNPQLESLRSQLDLDFNS